MRRIPCDQCTIRNLTLIADLRSEDLGDFQACTVTGLYKPRQIVFHEGTPANGLYVLCRGAVKLYRSDRFGRDYIIGVAAAGDVLGELALDDGETYSISAEALTEAQLSFLPRERLMRLIERHPQIAIRLIAALGKALATSRRKAGDLALKRADARLANLLLHLADGAHNGEAPIGDGTMRVPLDYSRRDLAEMIGVSTETAIRLLAKLKRNRMIATSAGEVVITDRERLARLAHHGDVTA